MSDDLVKRLRDLAQAKHDDLSIGDEAADRIAELEASVYQYVNHVVSYEGISFIDEMNWPLWAKLINDTLAKQAALEGGKKDE
jgi:hypothetical protein